MKIPSESVIKEWAEWLGSQGPFIPVRQFAITPEQAKLLAAWGYRYGFNRVVGTGDRGEYIGYFAPEAIDHNFIDGRTAL